MIRPHACRSGVVSLRRYYFTVPEADSVNSSDMLDCQAGCSQCSADSAIPTADREGIFTGWRLAAAALWVFVLPLVLAVVGAVVARSCWPGPGRMLLAAITGLAAGGAISWPAAKLIVAKPAVAESDGNET